MRFHVVLEPDRLDDLLGGLAGFGDYCRYVLAYLGVDDVLVY
jgi:hypothetical protein